MVSVSDSDTNDRSPGRQEPGSEGGDGDLDQGRFKTCSFYAFARVMHSMIGLKYDTFIPASNIVEFLEQEARRNHGEKSPVYGAQFNGSNIDKVVGAINLGNEGKQAKSARFPSKDCGSEWCVTVESEGITFDELVQVVNAPGGTFGLNVAYAVIKTSEVGHEYHAVAVVGSDPADPWAALVAENSWGASQKRMTVTAANFVSAALIHPKMHFWQTSGSAEKKPAPAVSTACAEFWKRFKVARSGAVGGAGTTSVVAKTLGCGGVYTGPMRDGSPNGAGIMIRANGIRVAGEWKDGKVSGCGVALSPDGGKEAGEYQGGEFQGCAVVVFADGAKVAGEFQGSGIHGCGVFVDADGDVKMAGEFCNKELHGCGVLASSVSKSVHAGKFEANKSHGPGVLHLSKDSVPTTYVGQFRTKKRHGRGTEFCGDGVGLDEVREGEWEDDVFVEGFEGKRRKKNAQPEPNGSGGGAVGGS